MKLFIHKNTRYILLNYMLQLISIVKEVKI